MAGSRQMSRSDQIALWRTCIAMTLTGANPVTSQEDAAWFRFFDPYLGRPAVRAAENVALWSESSLRGGPSLGIVWSPSSGVMGVFHWSDVAAAISSDTNDLALFIKPGEWRDINHAAGTPVPDDELLPSSGSTVSHKDAIVDSYSQPSEPWQTGSQMNQDEGGSKALKTIYGAGSLAGTVMGAYHGYKRSGGSVGAAVGWAILGAIFWPVTIPVSLAQGLGERK